MKIIPVLLLAILACACGGGYLSPLYKSPPDGGYDVLMEGVAARRAARTSRGLYPALLLRLHR